METCQKTGTTKMIKVKTTTIKSVYSIPIKITLLELEKLLNILKWGPFIYPDFHQYGTDHIQLRKDKQTISEFINSLKHAKQMSSRQRNYYISSDMKILKHINQIYKRNLYFLKSWRIHYKKNEGKK